MSEIKFTNITEMATSLKGWTIRDVKQLSNNGLALRLYHPAAEHDIALTIKATIEMGRSGNIVVANEGLLIHAEDIIAEH